MGVTDITIVTGAEHAGAIMNYLVNAHPEIDFTFKVQKQAGGIAQALSLVENVVQGSNIAVILDDNIFDNDFSASAKSFMEDRSGAMLFLKKILNSHRFGVAEVKEGLITSIEEKPKVPKSNLAVTGLYLFDRTVFDKIRLLKPSDRGELEITDVNNLYLQENRVRYNVIQGFWSDAGTHDSRKRAEEFVNETKYDPLAFRR